jgi:arabinogalactan oligomer/maltooligosaccharide transport system permease protein
MGLATIKWVGLDTFKLIFENTEFLGFFGDVFLWTVIYALMASITVYILGFIQAMIIESRYVKFKKILACYLNRSLGGTCIN